MSTKTPVTQQVIRDFLNSGIEYLICEGEESALVVVSAFVACPMGYMRLVEPGQRLLRLSSPSQYTTAYVSPVPPGPTPPWSRSGSRPAGGEVGDNPAEGGLFVRLPDVRLTKDEHDVLKDALKNHHLRLSKAFNAKGEGLCSGLITKLGLD